MPKTCEIPGCTYPVFGNNKCRMHRMQELAKEKPFKPRTAIKKVSDKEMVRKAKYKPLRAAYLANNQICEAGLDCCTKKATEIHHTYAGSKRSKYYLDTTTWMAVCRSCHNHIHYIDPKGAKERGYLK